MPCSTRHTRSLQQHSLFSVGLPSNTNVNAAGARVRLGRRPSGARARGRARILPPAYRRLYHNSRDFCTERVLQEEEEREREEAERRVREEAERAQRLEEAAARQRAKEAEARAHPTIR